MSKNTRAFKLLQIQMIHQDIRTMVEYNESRERIAEARATIERLMKELYG